MSPDLINDLCIFSTVFPQNLSTTFDINNLQCSYLVTYTSTLDQVLLCEISNGYIVIVTLAPLPRVTSAAAWCSIN